MVILRDKSLKMSETKNKNGQLNIATKRTLKYGSNAWVF